MAYCAPNTFSSVLLLLPATLNDHVDNVVELLLQGVICDRDQLWSFGRQEKLRHYLYLEVGGYFTVPALLLVLHTGLTTKVDSQLVIEVG